MDFVQCRGTSQGPPVVHVWWGMRHGMWMVCKIVGAGPPLGTSPMHIRGKGAFGQASMHCWPSPCDGRAQDAGAKMPARIAPGRPADVLDYFAAAGFASSILMNPWPASQRSAERA